MSYYSRIINSRLYPETISYAKFNLISFSNVFHVLRGQKDDNKNYLTPRNARSLLRRLIIRNRISNELSRWLIYSIYVTIDKLLSIYHSLPLLSGIFPFSFKTDKLIFSFLISWHIFKSKLIVDSSYKSYIGHAALPLFEIPDNTE
jgi:hypothetical protein